MIGNVSNDINTADEQLNALLAMEADVNQSQQVVALMKMRKQMIDKLEEFKGKAEKCKKNIQGQYRLKSEHEIKISQYRQAQDRRSRSVDLGYCSSSPSSSPQSYKSQRTRPTCFSPQTDCDPLTTSSAASSSSWCSNNTAPSSFSGAPGSNFDRSTLSQTSYGSLNHPRNSLDPSTGQNFCPAEYVRPLEQTTPVLRANTSAGTQIAGTDRIICNSYILINMSISLNTAAQVDADNVAYGSDQVAGTEPGQEAANLVSAHNNEPGTTGGSVSYDFIWDALFSPYTYIIFSDPEVICLLYTSPSPRDRQKSRMPSSA